IKSRARTSCAQLLNLTLHLNLNHRLSSLMAGGLAGNKKTHGRFEPWVLVEIQFSLDKRQRRRQLRRPAERLVEFVRTLRVENTAASGAGQAANFGHYSTFFAAKPCITRGKSKKRDTFR